MCETIVKKCEQVMGLAKIDDLENRSRQNNLMVYGINELDNETESMIRESVINDIFHAKMGIAVSSVERIHR